MKKIIWNAKARDFVRSLNHKTKIEIGTLLMILQSGEILNEPQSKPMKTIHPKAFELRIKDREGTYRIIYILAIQGQILIPHAFSKKTEKTPKIEIEIANKRLQELLNENK